MQKLNSYRHGIVFIYCVFDEVQKVKINILTLTLTLHFRVRLFQEAS